MQPSNERNAAQFLADHQAIVCKIARSFTQDSSDYDDLFQEVCIDLCAAFSRIPEDARESTYVYRVALNRAISWRRKRNTYLRHLTSFWRDDARRRFINDDAGEDSSQIELLYVAIRRLSESDRSLVLLYLDEMSANEMSEVLGVAPATVRKRMSRAKNKLTKIIKQLEGDHDR